LQTPLRRKLIVIAGDMREPLIMDISIIKAAHGDADPAEEKQFKVL